MGKHIASGFCDACTANGRMVRAVPGQRLCRECIRVQAGSSDEPLPPVDIQPEPIACAARTPAADVRFLAEAIIVLGIVCGVLFVVAAVWAFAQDNAATTTDGLWLLGYGIGAGLSAAFWSALVRGLAYGLELLEQIRDNSHTRQD